MLDQPSAQRACRVLVAGIGNIFLGDDAFGPEVIRRLPADGFGPEVRVTDYGIRGMHLAYDLLEDWDALILIDALPDRGSPGEVSVIEVRAGDGGPPGFDAHAMDPSTVIATLDTLGGVLPRTLLVGCQVVDIEEGMGLSEPVGAAVAPAVEQVRTLVRELLSDRAGSAIEHCDIGGRRPVERVR